MFLASTSELILAYVGLLGPIKRREKLLAQLIELGVNLQDHFMEKLHGPAGLNIGAVTPQEIAISIISEILTVVSQQQPISLSKKLGAIHA